MLFVAWQVVPDAPLVVVANRDEAHARPTDPAAWWDDCPRVLAGRDLKAGGTWSGVTADGRWSIVTNVRHPKWFGYEAPRSRGALVADFLCSETNPGDYAHRAAAEQGAYAGFNLLVGDRETLAYAATEHEAARTLTPGFYGLSNAVLDTPWPKIRRGGAAFQAWVENGAEDEDAILSVMRDETLAEDAELPETGVGLDHERILSPLFINGSTYGTRATTLLLFRADGTGRLVERSFGPDGVTRGTEQRYTFPLV